MTDAEFRALYVKSGLATWITGLGICAVGALPIYAVASGADHAQMTTATIVLAYVFGVLFIAVGALVLWGEYRTQKRLRAGDHPLFVALRLQDQKFVFWYHVVEMSYHMSTGKKGGSSWQLWVHGKNGEVYIAQLGLKPTLAEPALAYLAARFPKARQGNSEENEQAWKDYKASL